MMKANNFKATWKTMAIFTEINMTSTPTGYVLRMLHMSL